MPKPTPNANGYPIFRHGALEPLAPNLWRVVGSLPMPLLRTMYVHRLADGGLLIYSAVALDDAGMKALEALGTPKVLVLSHPMHTMDAKFYKDRYPSMQVFGEEDSQRRLPSIRFDARPEVGLKGHGLTAVTVPAMKYSDVALEVPVEGGVGLIVTDILSFAEGKSSFLLKLLGPPNGGGVSRIVKFRQVSERERVRAWIRGLAGRTDVRLLGGCHGGVIQADCGRWLGTAADDL